MNLDRLETVFDLVHADLPEEADFVAIHGAEEVNLGRLIGWVVLDAFNSTEPSIGRFDLMSLIVLIILMPN